MPPHEHSGISAVYDADESTSQTTHRPVLVFSLSGWPSDFWWQEFLDTGRGDGLTYPAQLSTYGVDDRRRLCIVVSGIDADAALIARVATDVESRARRATEGIVRHDRLAEAARKALEAENATRVQQMKTLMDSVGDKILIQREVASLVSFMERHLPIVVLVLIIVAVILYSNLTMPGT